MRRSATIPVTSVEDYLQIFRGMFGLTDEEVRILAEFIRLRDELMQKGDSNPDVFNAYHKKIVATRLGKSNFHTLNNYIKSMKNKSALTKTRGMYHIHKMLTPVAIGIPEEIIIVKVQWQGK